LRQVQPDRERPWRPPLNFRFRGAWLPATAVVGGVGTFAAWIVVISLDLDTLAAGATWMLLGIVTYVLYRRRQGLPLRQTVKLESLTPLGVEEVEYESVLIAFDDGDPFDTEAVVTAKALAARRRRAIHVLALVSVPANLPLDAELEEQERAAQSKIEQAKLILGQRVSGHIERVRLGASGQAIVEEAREIQAAAIVMPLRYRDGVPLYGKTLQTVLAKRPCRVLVSAQPHESSDGSMVAPPARSVSAG
jgi:APA family basic amino acid/polyamine antiporter